MRNTIIEQIVNEIVYLKDHIERDMHDMGEDFKGVL